MSKQSHIAERLMDSAAQLFLEEDFHSVSIRAVASHACTTSAMIHYYFGSKLGLFNAMLKRENGKLVKILYETMEQDDLMGFSGSMKKLMALYHENPNIPRFILRTWMYQQSTGSQVLLKSFDTEKNLVAKWYKEMSDDGKVSKEVNSEVVRIAFMSLTLLPSMVPELLLASYGRKGYEEFNRKYVEFCSDALLQSVN